MTALRIGMDLVAPAEGYFELEDQRIPLDLDLLVRIRSSQGTTIAQMYTNGDVEFAEGYEPTVAARVFWESLTRYWQYLLERDLDRIASGSSPQFGQPTP